MQDKIGMHCFISGKVQGVWFRASTQKEARRLRLTGWAKNLPDGRVEVLVFGGKKEVAELYEWLKHGPELAIVKGITYEEQAWEEILDFSVN